ncbi:MAG TPA: hypothetical protein VFI31_21140 [Pirellulales bacterium]|nr:hypothetical protein [Pirellulales bacterium]
MPTVVMLVAIECPFAPAHAGDNRGAASSVSAEGDAAHQSEIARLVRELGAPTFTARQRAQRRLIEIGLNAKPALEAACDDPDDEIQRRAREALAAIHDVAFYVRLGEFLADEDPDDDHDLAGWRRYRSIVGANGVARRLFGDMQRAERELLEAADRSPNRTGGLLESRCQQAESQAQNGDNDRQSSLSLGTVAALLFVGSNPDVPVSEEAGKCISRLNGQSSLQAAMQTRSTAAVVRGLLGAWVSRSFDRDSSTAYQNLWMAMQYQLKEAVPVALALIQPPGGLPFYQQYAILAVGKLGGREHVPALMPLLDDERPIGLRDRTGHESDTQIRDVALAVMAHLTGQKLADYGFTHAKANGVLLFNSNTLGFNDPAAREQAIKKWRAWWKTEAASDR